MSFWHEESDDSLPELVPRDPSTNPVEVSDESVPECVSVEAQPLQGTSGGEASSLIEVVAIPSQKGSN